MTKINRYRLIINKKEWSIAEGVKLTAAEVLNKLGLSLDNYGVWQMELDANILLEPNDNLDPSFEYISGIKIIMPADLSGHYCDDFCNCPKCR